MAVEQYLHATQYQRNEITLLAGVVGDITSVGVYFDVNPNFSPEVDDFTSVDLVDGTDDPLPALGRVGKIDILQLIGTKSGAHMAIAAPGDYQKFVLVQTISEDLMFKLDTVTII